jgi:hypothetical protein
MFAVEIRLGDRLSSAVQTELQLAIARAQSRRHGDRLRVVRATSTLEPEHRLMAKLRDTTVMMASSADGTVYCHDLRPELWDSPVALAFGVNPKPAGYRVLAAHYRLAGLIDHEMGHLLWPTLRVRRAREIYDRLGPDWIERNLSSMATRSLREFTAEAYALLQTDLPIPEAILGELRPIFR